MTGSINFADLDLEKELRTDSKEIKLKAKEIVEWVSAYESQSMSSFSAVRRKFESEAYSCVGKLRLVTVVNS